MAASCGCAVGAIMTDVEQHVRDEWGTILIHRHENKAHLFTDCQYIADKEPQKKDVELYPKGCLEFCSVCTEWFEQWRDGFQGDPNYLCDRCGGAIESDYWSRLDYCAECNYVIERRRLMRE